LSDFRTELYERYVSTFKGAERPVSSADRESYFRWCRHKFLPLFDDLPRDARILELGCGAGDMLEYLGRNGFSAVEGIDLAPEQVQLATERGLNARVADVFDVLGSASGGYQAIVALDFLEHFTKDELMTLVPTLRDALAPGGVLIMQTPNGQGLFSNQVVYGDLTHLTIFIPESFQQLFRLWGFDDFRFVETGPVPDGLKGRLRVVLWRLITRMASVARMIESGKSQAIWTENMICRCTRG